MAGVGPVHSQLGPGLYVHIPFCARKCFYCDFTAYVNRHPVRVEEYVRALTAEITLRSNDPAMAGTTFHTVFFGGGTPSLLPPDLLAALLTALRRHFRLTPAAEITLEANPEDLTAPALARWRTAGVTRLSIGVQAFQDSLLQALGRNHTAAMALAAYERARAAGFDNINLDLMFGLPGQSGADWQATLDILLDLTPLPDHVSTYGLQVEPDTLFWRRRRERRLPLPPDDLTAAMYEDAMARLTTAGCEHYEVSNFARPGRRSQHNLALWHFHDYLGLGAGAWSFWQDRRWVNERFLRPYNDALEAARLPVAAVDEPRSQAVTMAEMVLMGTRLREGLSLTAFRRRFGVELAAVFGPALDHCHGRGLVALDKDRLHLTRRGLMLANDVWAQFLTV